MDEQRSLRENLILALFSIAGLALLTYTAYRAYALSFTHDESLTYLRYVRNDLFDTSDANNHFLNTFLMKCTRALFGISELALRLPNVLAHIVFLYYSARIVILFRSAVLTITAFILINFNPYLLEFFSLARGYGMSMALLMGSLYYVYLYLLKDEKRSFMLKGFAMAALAVTANYGLLNYFLVLWLMFVVCEYFYSSNSDVRLFLRKLPALMIVPAVLMAFVVPRILKLREVGDFYFNSMGSWRDMLVSLVDSTLFEAEYPEEFKVAARGAIFIFIGIGILVSVWNIIKSMPNGEMRFLIFVVLAILLSMAANFAQNMLLNANYPNSRTALYYIPLISLMIALLFNYLGSESKAIQLCFAVIGALSLSNMALAMNLSHTQTWSYDMNTKYAMLELAEAGGKKGNLKFNTTIAANSHFKPAIDYYRDKYEMYWLNKARHIGSYDLFADYYYMGVNPEEQGIHQELTVIAEFPETRSALFDNRTNPKGILIKELLVDFEKEGEIISYPNTFKRSISYSGEVSNLAGLAPPYSATYADTFYKSEFPSPIIISAKMMVYGMEPGFSGGMIMTCEHEGEFYFWEMSDIRADMHEAKEWKPTYLTCTIPPPESEYFILKVFLFNYGNTDIYIDDFHIKTIEPKK